MKNKIFSGIRWKMFKYFLLSIVIAVAGVAFTVAFLLFVTRLNIHPFNAFLRALMFMGDISPFVYMFLAGSIIFMLSFLFLSRGIIRDFKDISQSLDVIASGNLEHRIPVRSRDELGELAENINRMTGRLQRSITEERQTQQAKNELVTSVSHDLRTPLTSILGYLELIEEDRYRDEVELRHYTQIIYTKARRLRQMIDDLFEYTRLYGGAVKFNLTRLDLGELLEQLAVEIRPLDKEGLIYRTFPSEEKIIVLADGDRLVRVFENLLSNAAQYGKEGRFADITWRKEDNEAVVEVINYGPPIPAGELPHIFERFYRVEKSRAESSGGTGLGLAIAKNIVELNGGRIAVYSDAERTLFEVRLPLYDSSLSARWVGPTV